MERRNQIHRYDMQLLDEPQRAAGSRTWRAEDQNILAEDLMASNRYIKPVLFPTPLNAMIDNRIFDIATSQVVIPRLAFAELYTIDRPQLDRASKRPRTPKIGTLVFDKPSPSLWHAYCKMFDEDYQARNKRAIERVRSIQKEADKEVSSLQVEELVSLIVEKPVNYVGKTGSISVSRVLEKHKVPYNRAQQASRQANEQLRARKALEDAERDD